jgi:hypothetical protein
MLRNCCWGTRACMLRYSAGTVGLHAPTREMESYKVQLQATFQLAFIFTQSFLHPNTTPQILLDTQINHTCNVTTTTMPNETRNYGDLKVTLTKEFNWVYSDSNTGAKRDVTIFHAKPQGDLRPLGSFATPNYQDQNNKRATILVGNAANGSVNPAVASPTGYTQIWTDRKSGGSHDGSFWKPNAPSGYVALGDVCNGSYNAPSNDAIWCVRLDLTLQSDFASDSLWSDSGSGATSDCSLWSSSICSSPTLITASLSLAVPRSSRCPVPKTLHVSAQPCRHSPRTRFLAKETYSMN